MNFDENWDIHGNCDQNRDFLKIWTKITIIKKFWPKSRFIQILTQNRDFSKNFWIKSSSIGWVKGFLFLIFTKIVIFRKISLKCDISKNGDLNRDFLPQTTDINWQFWLRSRFSRIVTKISRISRKFWPKSWEIWKILPKIEIFDEKVWLKLRFM